MGRAALIALFVAVLGWQARASADEPVQASLSVDREVSSVGDRITVTLVVTREPGVLLAPLQAPDLGPDIELLETLPPQHEPLASGATRSRFRYRVAAFRTGELQIPPFAVVYALPGGETAYVATEPAGFTIRSVIPPGQNPTDIREVKPPLDLPLAAPATPLARPLVGAVLALDLVLLALALRRRGRRAAPRVRPVAKPAAPAHEAELERAAGLLAAGKVKEFYRHLARTVRGYLAQQYELPATALTRSELEHRMRSAPVDRWLARMVVGLLEEADRVVYAQYRPASERAEGALRLARQIVETAPAAPDQEAARAGA